MLTEDKYLELFPHTSYQLGKLTPTFGEYAQTWLDSREIVKNTRNNYKRVLNRYWMAELATTMIDKVNSHQIRKLVNATTWPSVTERQLALTTISSIFLAALTDELVTRNPVAAIPRGKAQGKEPDPYPQEEADKIIAHLHDTLKDRMKIYANYYEVAFYTGMRPCELLALRPEELDLERRRVRVCRIMVDGEIHERVKTKYARTVLLNDRALMALKGALAICGNGPYVFQPVDGRREFIASENTPKRYLVAAVKALGFTWRKQYATRHTYATICLMAGMTPAFVAKQLGHSVQVLLTTYAKWIDSDADLLELNKLNAGTTGTKLVQSAPHQAPSP
ncbi:Tyrosine recombinase XerC [compost metagenome]